MNAIAIDDEPLAVNSAIRFWNYKFRKAYIIIAFITSILFLSCHKNKKVTNKSNIPISDIVNSNIVIYRMDHSDYKVEAIRFIKDSLFYFPNGLVLTNYKKNPSEGMPFNDVKLKERLKETDFKKINERMNEADFKNLSTTKIFNGCDCGAVSENDYTIRFPDNPDSKDIVFPEIIGCPENSECYIFELLRSAFLEEREHAALQKSSHKKRH